MLDGVLRREDEERLGQRARLALDRDLALGHRLEERGLRARRGAVHLVGEDDLGEDRAGTEEERAVGGAVDRAAEDVGRQEVGRELDAGERGAERARERLRQRRLAGAGDVLEQDVPAGEDGGEDALDGLVGAADRGAEVGPQGLEFGNGFHAAQYTRTTRPAQPRLPGGERAW